MTAADLLSLVKDLPEWSLFAIAGLSFLGSAWSSYHAGRGALKATVGAARWVWPVAKLSPLMVKILDELSSGPIDTRCSNALQTGSLHVRCNGAFDGYLTHLNLQTVSLGEEDVMDALSVKQQRKVLKAATQAHARGRRESAQARAAAVLAKLA